MAKTAYGQRMYRARTARATEIAKSGSGKEYTVNAETGRAIDVEEVGYDDYRVTDVVGGTPSANAVNMTASSINNRYGVDILKGQLIDGVTTKGFSEAMYMLDSEGATGVVKGALYSYLTGQETFNQGLGGASASVVQVFRNAASNNRYSEGTKILADIVSKFDNQSWRI